MNADTLQSLTWTDVAGKTREVHLPQQPWEAWALHVEELTGFTTRAWLEEGLEAWENGQSAEDFAGAWMLFSPSMLPEDDLQPALRRRAAAGRTDVATYWALFAAAALVAAALLGLLWWGAP